MLQKSDENPRGAASELMKQLDANKLKLMLKGTLDAGTRVNTRARYITEQVFIQHISKSAVETLVASVQYALMVEYMDMGNGQITWNRFTQDVAELVATAGVNPMAAGGGNCATM